MADNCQNKQQAACQNANMTMPQVLEKIGAGEGNRTLVISLEGARARRSFKAYSDNSTLSGASDPKREFSSVRTATATSLAAFLIDTLATGNVADSTHDIAVTGIKPRLAASWPCQCSTQSLIDPANGVIDFVIKCHR